MPQFIVDVHKGVNFQIEAVPRGSGFEGRYTLSAHADAAQEGSSLDAYRPTTDNLWATEREALNYATEAAHHAIEGIQPFTGRGRGGV